MMSQYNIEIRASKSNASVPNMERSENQYKPPHTRAIMNILRDEIKISDNYVNVTRK